MSLGFLPALDTWLPFNRATTKVHIEVGTAVHFKTGKASKAVVLSPLPHVSSVTVETVALTLAVGFLVTGRAVHGDS